ncbi:hypothetical protein KDN34_01195 [Shewanella yunxiaonensis]|uniref:Uncharacterized protein n=1 Tax=Shewanella yunxiaonensis TaxID=2829809 RepID=A0ABX7YTZ2_9GAMM|nr:MULTISPECIES: hypothetical protein [Shewanella]MDF0535559.1 hypothetical protein [Shewanella sp. A32]QUN06127.1 hypothetical protein KDN34_01195 [Shewanella yunxiaonensis]
MGLDSIYAMVAQPAKATYEPQKDVQQVSTATAIAAYNPDDPQFQQPVNNDRRLRYDRRKEQKPFARERRKSSRRQADQPPPAKAVEEGKGTFIDIDV